MSLSRTKENSYHARANEFFVKKNYRKAAEYYTLCSQQIWGNAFLKVSYYVKWAECELVLQNYSRAIELANMPLYFINGTEADGTFSSHLETRSRNIIAQAQAALLNLPKELVPALTQNHFDFAAEGSRQLVTFMNYKLAAEYYDKAIEDLKTTVNCKNFDMVMARYCHRLALCELHLKNYEKAESLAKTSFDIFITTKLNAKNNILQGKNIKYTLEAEGKKLQNRVFKLPSLPVAKISEKYSLPFVKFSEADVHTLFGAQNVSAKTCNNATFNVHENADGSVTVDKVTPANTWK